MAQCMGGGGVGVGGGGREGGSRRRGRGGGRREGRGEGEGRVEGEGDSTQRLTRQKGDDNKIIKRGKTEMWMRMCNGWRKIGVWKYT